MEDINININTEHTKSLENIENTITTKPTKIKASRAPKTPKPVTIKIDISYQNYKNNTIEFNKYKLPELKDALKKYNLKISGKKEVLIERLETYFKKHSKSIIIQRLFRGWIVRYLLRLKGPALKNVSLCVNDSDFVTMEPLNEMSKDVFFSYKDSKDFIYGFDITSLIQMLLKKNKIENPYNREKINPILTNQIKTVYNLSFLVYPFFKNDNERLQYQNTMRNTNQRPIHNTINNRFNNNNTQNRMNANVISPEMMARHNRLTEIREKPLIERINHLFTEIDGLGNYTNSSWFTNLDIRNCISLYRSLYDIWYFRSNLSREVRNFICPNQNPFDGIFPRATYNELSLPQIQSACLTAIENIVYLGINDDYRKIGTFHVLSALTLVSSEARQAMPWLYESVAF
jgi:hypothetical protein